MKNPLPLAKLLSHEQFSEATNGEKARIFGAKDGLGNTPLMAAALSGKPDSISLLVGEGAPPNEVNGEGRTALILSVLAEGNPELAARALLVGGADPTIRDAGMTMDEFNSSLEKGGEPIGKEECAKMGGKYYADPPRRASEYARLLKHNSLAEKLEAAERRWKKAHPQKKG